MSEELIDFKTVQKLLGGRSRSSIYRDIALGRIPEPMKTGTPKGQQGGGRNYWRRSEIERIVRGR